MDRSSLLEGLAIAARVVVPRRSELLSVGLALNCAWALVANELAETARHVHAGECTVSRATCRRLILDSASTRDSRCRQCNHQTGASDRGDHPLLHVYLSRIGPSPMSVGIVGENGGCPYRPLATDS